MKIIFWLLLLIPYIQAGELDLGLGYIGLNTHHYKGSDETKTFNLYVPYVNYQGDYLEADNAVINSKFFKSRFLSFKLSLGAAPNVENDNKARADMPELLYNFGIGPMLVLHIFKFPRFILNIEANYRQ
jgi:outer membrane scaffolding protein for murein synthesis (MipA/OmpV family)